MQNLLQLKSELEKVLKITSWNPTQEQLASIAVALAASNIPSISKVERVILSVCPDTKFVITAGVDNSDLRTLIAIARRTIQSQR